MTFSDIAKLIASAEITPELSQYWAKRYLRLLDDKYFVLSEKTNNLLLASSGSLAPTTPYGYLDLARFVSPSNQIVDEVTLQNTVETAIRFLDSSLEIVKFSPQSKEIVDKFRKIGLGIMNFKNFLTLRGNPDSEIVEINYLGAIISGSAYRASEALAEEKGVGMDWENIEQILRPKSFEYWYDTETGEISSGLDLSLLFDQSSITSTNYKIIPRRNSAILLYPSDISDWNKWSDRDENLPQSTEIQKEVKVLENSESDFDLKNLENIVVSNDDTDAGFDISESDSFETQNNQTQSSQLEPKLDLSRSKIYEADNSQDGKAIPLVTRLIEDGKRKLSSWLNPNHSEEPEKTDLDVDVDEMTSAEHIIEAKNPQIIEFPLADISMTDTFQVSSKNYTFEPIPENTNVQTPTFELENEKNWKFDSSGLISKEKYDSITGLHNLEDEEMVEERILPSAGTSVQDLKVKNQKQEVEIFALKAQIKNLESERESQIADWEKLLLQMTDRDKVQKTRINELENNFNSKPNTAFFNFGGGIQSEPTISQPKPNPNQGQKQELKKIEASVDPLPTQVLERATSSNVATNLVPNINQVKVEGKTDDTSLLLRMKRMKS